MREYLGSGCTISSRVLCIFVGRSLLFWCSGANGFRSSPRSVDLGVFWVVRWTTTLSPNSDGYASDPDVRVNEYWEQGVVYFWTSFGSVRLNECNALSVSHFLRCLETLLGGMNHFCTEGISWINPVCVHVLETLDMLNGRTSIYLNVGNDEGASNMIPTVFDVWFQNAGGISRGEVTKVFLEQK